MKPKAKQTRPRTQKKTQEPDDLFIHFMCACKVFYEVDGDIKQREMNTMILTQSPNLTREALGYIRKGVMQRLGAENDVTPDKIKDIYIQNIFPLGQMTTEEFQGTPEKPMN